MTRLNKYMAECGVASRRMSDLMIKDGRVKVNGKVVYEMGIQVQEGVDRILVDGRPVKPATRKVYVLLNKPKGYVTTAKDERGRKTVFELINTQNRVFPVGRLDIKSEGLLLFTNDGELAHRLMHPGFKVVKTYRVKLEKPFDPKEFDTLRNGLELDDGLTLPCKASFYTDDAKRVEIRLQEGRKNQVRRMFAALGYDVINLKRVQYGPLTINGLDRSRWRYLSQGEIKQLKTAAGLIKKQRGR